MLKFLNIYYVQPIGVFLCAPCLGDLLITVIKCPDTNNWKEKGFILGYSFVVTLLVVLPKAQLLTRLTWMFTLQGHSARLFLSKPYVSL